MLDDAIAQGICCQIVNEMERDVHFYDDLISLIKLIRIIRKEKPSIVHTHTAKAGALGRIAAFITRVPHIYHTFHGHVFYGYFGNQKTKLYILLEKILAKISSKIVVISERQKYDIVRKYKITTENHVKFIPIGLDWKSGFISDSNFDFRQRYNISRDKFLVGIVGRLVPVKDIYLFIEIGLKLLESNKYKYHFVIIGDGELRGNLESSICESGHSDKFTFTGWLNLNQHIYQSLDVLLLTSRNEGTPLTIIEALVSGVPVVARDVGGVADIMNLYKSEYLVSERNSERFVELIKQLETDMEKPSKNIQNIIMNLYSSDRLVRDIIRLYLKTP